MSRAVWRQVSNGHCLSRIEGVSRTAGLSNQNKGELGEESRLLAWLFTLKGQSWSPWPHPGRFKYLSLCVLEFSLHTYLHCFFPILPSNWGGRQPWTSMNTCQQVWNDKWGCLKDSPFLMQWWLVVDLDQNCPPGSYLAYYLGVISVTPENKTILPRLKWNSELLVVKEQSKDLIRF